MCTKSGLGRAGAALALMAMALVLASCGSQPSTAPNTPGPTASGAVALRITQVNVGKGFPTEGALSYIRIEHSAGGTLMERRLPSSSKLTIKLDPGAYRLVSWQRICDANCGHLDPPTARCAHPFTAGQKPLQATISTDYISVCRIAFRG